MYHLYHTPAFVLGSTPTGEGSKLVSFFTREFGFLTAIAQSAREERSKLRYGLQDFSYSEITLVRGKEFWRLTRAECVSNIFEDIHGSRDASRMLGRIVALLRRLLAGEEKNEPLFDTVREGLRFLGSGYSPLEKGALPSSAGGMLTTSALADSGTPFIKGDKLDAAEIILVLRILYFLGYLAPRGEFDPFLSHADLWDESVISKALLFRTLAVSEINNSLRETQL